MRCIGNEQQLEKVLDGREGALHHKDGSPSHRLIEGGLKLPVAKVEKADFTELRAVAGRNAPTKVLRRPTGKELSRRIVHMKTLF